MKKIKEISKYLKGEWFCRFFHKPIFYNLGGYGGKDVFGRRRKSYRIYNCVVCDTRWESEREPKWNKLSKEEQSRTIEIINRGMNS